MSKFIEIQVKRELTPKHAQFVLINTDCILTIGETRGFAAIGLAGEEGIITCENSYEDVKRMVLNE